MTEHKHWSEHLADQVILEKKEPLQNQKEEKIVTLKESEYLKLKEEADKAKEHWDKILRLQADFENTRKRLEREKQDFVKFANEGIIVELLWFLKGESTIKYLVDNDVHIWDSWPYKYYLEQLDGNRPSLSQKEFIQRIKDDAKFAQKWGELGPVYGVQWRHWQSAKGGEIDQIKTLINNIKTDPSSRRHIVSAWNVADIEEMAKAGLPPCHTMFQFYVLDGKLS